MKEFVEKLIGRLEEIKKQKVGLLQLQDRDFLRYSYELRFLEEVKEIINELAEEYINTSTDTSTNSSTWIPCSERLPSESGEYLTFVDYADETFIAIDEIDCEGITKEWNCTPNYHIIAWQPLPVPYKEGDPDELS